MYQDGTVSAPADVTLRAMQRLLNSTKVSYGNAWSRIFVARSLSKKSTDTTQVRLAARNACDGEDSTVLSARLRSYRTQAGRSSKSMRDYSAALVEVRDVFEHHRAEKELKQ